MMQPGEQIVPGGRRRGFRVLWIPFAALLGASPSVAQRGTFSEPQVKAEFVERFTRFIDWPADGSPGPEVPFVLGVVGRNEVGSYLEQLARARAIKNRRVEFRQLDGPQGVESCNAVWITHAAHDQLPAVLARTSGKPILTIGDTEGFAEQGVLINLRRESTRITFQINLIEVKKSGLKFSSRLLELGEIVEPWGPP